MEKSSNILLVEDHHLSAKIAKSILTHLNCEVDIAMDGKTTLEMFQNKHYDLIFIDIGLPDMNGYEVTRRIRAQEINKEHTPIVALTAHADTDNQQQCLDVAMNAMISKPLTKDRAESILDTFIFSRHPKNGATEEKIIDFEYAKKLLGGEEPIVHDMLAMLVESLPYELKKLEAAYQQENWNVIKDIAHKLKGASSYCGTLALKSACDKLETCIRSESTTQIPELYRQMLVQIVALQQFMGKQSHSH